MDADPKFREAEEFMSTAKVRLALKYPYFASAISNLRLVPIVHPDMPTMGVDKFWRCYYSPDFVVKSAATAAGIDAVAGVLLHEVIHLLRRHPERGMALHGDSEQLANIFGIAADAAVNQDVRNDGMLPFPDFTSPVYPEKLGLPLGLTAEEYFTILRQRAQEEPEPEQGQGQAGEGDGDEGEGQGQGEGQGEGQGQGQGEGQGQPSQGPPPIAHGSAGHGLQRPWEMGPPTGLDDGSEGLPENEQELVRQQVAQAVMAQGNAPGSWKRWAEVPPKSFDVRGHVRKMAAKHVRDAQAGTAEYTYSRTRRNGDSYAPYILPGIKKRTLTIEAVFDTSGSMGDTEIGLAAAGIMDVVKEHSLSVYASDTAIRSRTDLTQGQRSTALLSNLVGGGGTDMTRAIEELDNPRRRRANPLLRGKPQPDLIICLTDGYTGWPKQKTRTPLLVVLVAHGGYGGGPPKWAKVIHALGD